jgi:hypothetical protein
VEQVPVIGKRQLRRVQTPGEFAACRHSRLPSAYGIAVQGCGGWISASRSLHAGPVPAVHRRLSLPRLQSRRRDGPARDGSQRGAPENGCPLPAAQPTGDPRGCPAGIGTASLASLGTRRAVPAVKDPGTEFRQYRRSSEPAGRDHELLAPLNDLAPQFAPNDTGGRMAAVREVRAKDRVREARPISFRPTGTVPHLSGNNTLALTWDSPTSQTPDLLPAPEEVLGQIDENPA